jgi:murein DD-endopeptidase MepM/ murein hydrolase activator NlpD
MTDYYRIREYHPVSGEAQKWHRGNDYGAKVGSNIHVAAKGVVAAVGYQYNEDTGTGWGNYVEVKHFDDKGVLQYKTRYAHMDKMSELKVGQKVDEGDILGSVGKTGGVTGPHLHVELMEYKNNKFNYLDITNPEYGNIGKYNDLSTIKSK